MTEEVEITEIELDELKKTVLLEKLDEICEQLGDPGRYFASFKAKDILNQTDCELIKAEKTSVERSYLLIEKISRRRGRRGEHPYDVFVGALKRMRVHVHIVRILNTALVAKRTELVSSKRSKQEYIREFGNSFPSNGVSHVDSAPNTPDGDESLVHKGPFSSSSPSSHSSPLSSSSYHGTTPPNISSPHTDTDGSFFSPPSRHPSDAFPLIPVGFNGTGQRIQTTDSYSRSNSQTTPTTVAEVIDPSKPCLPPGYNKQGKRIDDISEYTSSSIDSYHPSHGPMPVDAPLSSLPLRSHTSSETEQASAIAEMKSLINRLQTELNIGQERLMSSENEVMALRQQNEELLMDNKRLIAAKNQFESYISVVTGTSQGPNGSGGMATTPQYGGSGNWSNSSQYGRKRSTEPLDMRSYFNHRQSEPAMLSVPARPNKLPLNKKGLRSPSSQPSSYDHSPMYDPEMFPYKSRQSPGSDGRQVQHGGRMSVSRDDLTSGGEDRSSVRSFESGNSGNITLTTQISTTETIV